MALKHEFNRESERDGGNPIVRLDAFLTQRADSLAEAWQARTRISRQALTLGLYVAATACGLAHVALSRELTFLGIAFLAYVGSAPGRQRGSLVEEMQMEVSGLPRDLLKYVGVFVLAAGLFGLATSLPFLLLDLTHGTIAVADLTGLAGGLALTILKLADYIARTNPSNKGDRERPIERVRRAAAAPTAA